MKKVTAILVGLGLTVAANAGMNKVGKYKCTETKSDSYYILTRMHNGIIDEKSGYFFNKVKTDVNDYKQHYTVFTNNALNMDLQDYTDTKDGIYLVNWFIYNGNDLEKRIQLDCVMLENHSI